jgi:hypothetical protein
MKIYKQAFLMKEKVREIQKQVVLRHMSLRKLHKAEETEVMKM